MKKFSSSYQKLFKAAVSTTVATGAFVAVTPASMNANVEDSVFITDVIKGEHFYEPVLNLSSRGVIQGDDDGIYKPYNTVTRGQAAKILALTLGLDTENVENPGFTDVKVSDEYYGPIAALVKAGIVQGYEDKTFKPGNQLTRAQMAKILNVGFDFEVEKLTSSPYTDVKSSDWYADYVQTLITHEITTGNTPTTFSPNAFVTRGQMASFVVRSEAAVAKLEISSEIMNITDTSVELNNGTYALPAGLKELFHTSNLEVLKGAVLKFAVKDDMIVKVNSIEIKASGSESTNLSLDGKKSTYEGKIIISGDYISLNNLKIKGNLEIKSKDSEIYFGTETIIGNLILPEGVNPEDIIKNFAEIEINIEKIGGKKNPSFKTVTPTAPETSASPVIPTPPVIDGGGSGSGQQPEAKTTVTLTKDLYTLGIAGDKKITGLAPGKIYTVKEDGRSFLVNANGTLVPYNSPREVLLGTEITGLDNSKTYNVTLLTSVVDYQAEGRITYISDNDSWYFEYGNQFYVPAALTEFTFKDNGKAMKAMRASYTDDEWTIEVDPEQPTGEEGPSYALELFNINSTGDTITLTFNEELTVAAEDIYITINGTVADTSSNTMTDNRILSISLVNKTFTTDDIIMVYINHNDENGNVIFQRDFEFGYRRDIGTWVYIRWF